MCMYRYVYLYIYIYISLSLSTYVAAVILKRDFFQVPK